MLLLLALCWKTVMCTHSAQMGYLNNYLSYIKLHHTTHYGNPAYSSGINMWLNAVHQASIWLCIRYQHGCALCIDMVQCCASCINMALFGWMVWITHQYGKLRRLWWILGMHCPLYYSPLFQWACWHEAVLSYSYKKELFQALESRTIYGQQLVTLGQQLGGAKTLICGNALSRSPVVLTSTKH